MSYWGRVTVLVEKAMRDGTPWTAQELAEHTGISRDTISKSLTRMRDRREVHIAYWSNEHSVQRKYPRPVYRIGNKADAKKPKPDTSANKTKAWRDSKKIRVSSVFDLGIKVSDRLAA